ncbi:GLPGLI family protein [Winogradskyella jejuensis]|uniref:GLPGLI family protein n=1 Tax=Winogradskyella jejuensis TaxID=1089305 RepID=A0A1M5PFE2_9FLAO|nr:GLPGLI family protein [Winogradskyella jejuensis]SHH00438.1 GLPGLI family protein [Winogradskyella jejuensis]
MKTVIRVLFLSLALVFTSAQAQDFQGKAVYKTSRAIDIKIDSTKVNDELHKQMQAMLRKQFQKTFTLNFDKEASVYKEDESLAPPQVGGGDIQVMVIGDGGGGDILYKNTKDKRYTDQKDVYGKIFLVKDELKPIEWKLESETKYIGEYQCFKATFSREIEVDNSTSFSSSDNEKDERDIETVKETQIVTAWYTPQIPVNNGPGNYYGLPGLILEVSTDKQQIVCTKIILNPEKKIEISEPTKGKEIDQEGYDKIMEKKRKEMLERFKPRKGNRGGEAIELRIGG